MGRRTVPIAKRIESVGTSNKLAVTLLHYALKSSMILGLLGRTVGVNMISRRSLRADMLKIVDKLFLIMAF